MIAGDAGSGDIVAAPTTHVTLGTERCETEARTRAMSVPVALARIGKER